MKDDVKRIKTGKEFVKIIYKGVFPKYALKFLEFNKETTKSLLKNGPKTLKSILPKKIYNGK
jgi:hypothetical protein